MPPFLSWSPDRRSGRVSTEPYPPSRPLPIVVPFRRPSKTDSGRLREVKLLRGIDQGLYAPDGFLLPMHGVFCPCPAFSVRGREPGSLGRWRGEHVGRHREVHQKFLETFVGLFKLVVQRGHVGLRSLGVFEDLDRPA